MNINVLPSFMNWKFGSMDINLILLSALLMT